MAKSTTEPAVKASARNLSSQSPESATITDNDIARRAYDLYLARGCENGRDVDDWLQAERELKNGSSVVAV